MNLRNLSWMLLSGLLFSATAFADQPKIEAPQPVAKKHIVKKKSTLAVEEKKAEEVKPAETPAVNDKLRDRNTLLAKITQSLDNPTAASDWFKKLGISGRLNMDVGKRSHPDFTKESDNRIALAGARLDFDESVNEWISGHAGLFYASKSDYYYPSSPAASNTNIDFDEGYVTIANFSKSPVYLRAGKQYLPFGSYRRQGILRPLTRMLTETRETAAELGFVDFGGLYGSLSAFNGLAPSSHPSRDRINDYSAALGYENLDHLIGYDVSADYLYNFADVGFINYNLPASNYTNRVAAMAANADIMTGPFNFGLRFVTAFSRFSPTDFSYQTGYGATRGAKPRAGMANAGYLFKTYDKDSKVNVSYQYSGEAHNVNTNSTALHMPKNRIGLGYAVNILKQTILTLEYDRDHDYTPKNGGTNGYNNTVAARFTVLI